MVNQLHGRPIISHLLICISIHCTKPNKSKNHIGISFITWFCRKSIYLLGFQIRNSVRITKGSDNGDSDNRSPTVYTHKLHMYMCVHEFLN